MNQTEISLVLAGSPKCQKHGDYPTSGSLTLPGQYENIAVRVCAKCVYEALIELTRLQRIRENAIMGGATREAANLVVRKELNPDIEDDSAAKRFALLELH